MHWIVLWEILKYFEEILYNTHGYIFAIMGGCTRWFLYGCSFLIYIMLAIVGCGL